MSQVDLEKFAEVLGNNLFEDLRRDLKKIIPLWLETMLKQRLKGLVDIEERIDRMEQDNRQRNKDIETIALSIEKLQADFAHLAAKATELPKEIKETVKEDNKQLAQAISSDFEAISERKPKSLLRFFKRGKK